eukprot:CAMPEP_0179845750 /NCGR_PEP_ID=MMETSP0982-20121206/5189_1 /TAXON_ID=483367 /ORGANISM="non described non described, Strain CCMP 2436" /LENGTH=74 /DNA_ID=CAMNT_0021730835 /DNA_START=758 /DNA_END=980 /DNA_ORIENTATION=+
MGSSMPVCAAAMIRQNGALMIAETIRWTFPFAVSSNRCLGEKPSMGSSMPVCAAAMMSPKWGVDDCRNDSLDIS